MSQGDFGKTISAYHAYGQGKSHFTDWFTVCSTMQAESVKPIP